MEATLTNLDGATARALDERMSRSREGSIRHQGAHCEWAVNLLFLHDLRTSRHGVFRGRVTSAEPLLPIR